MAKKKVAKKAKGKKKAAKRSKVRESLIVGSKVKAYIKGNGCMTSKDTLAELSDKVYDLLDGACARTQANRRSTVKPQDV